MPFARANGLTLDYETFGDPTGRPLLLIMGLSVQMIYWAEEFCRGLAERGHHVIRFDNRDTGRSTTFDGASPPSLLPALGRYFLHLEIPTVYTLEDMAADAIGLLDALGIDRAHVCGASMGGMIAQTLAIHHASRISSITSMMSSTGNRKIPLPRLKAFKVLLSKIPTDDRKAYIDYSLWFWESLGSPDYPFDQERIRACAAEAFDRGVSHDGMVRQLLAIMKSGDRGPALREVETPTLIVHGKEDPVMRVEGALDTARVLQNSKLMLFDGVGHDLPRAIWPEVIEAMSAHTRAAEGTPS